MCHAVPPPRQVNRNALMRSDRRGATFAAQFGQPFQERAKLVALDAERWLTYCGLLSHAATMCH